MLGPKKQEIKKVRMNKKINKIKKGLKKLLDIKIPPILVAPYMIVLVSYHSDIRIARKNDKVMKSFFCYIDRFINAKNLLIKKFKIITITVIIHLSIKKAIFSLKIL